jgi:hypothetical protein
MVRYPYGAEAVHAGTNANERIMDARRALLVILGSDHADDSV